MAVRQNRRSVRDYVAEFKNCVDRLSSYDKATLLEMSIWVLEKDLAEKVSMAHPKTLLSAIGIVGDLELAVRFAHRPPVKGSAASSLGLGTQTSCRVVVLEDLFLSNDELQRLSSGLVAQKATTYGV